MTLGLRSDSLRLKLKAADKVAAVHPKCLTCLLRRDPR